MAREYTKLPPLGSGMASASMWLQRSSPDAVDADCRETLTAAKLGLDQKFSSNLMNAEQLGCRDTDWNTPLHLACREGKLSTAELIISSGADLNCKNSVRDQ